MSDYVDWSYDDLAAGVTNEEWLAVDCAKRHHELLREAGRLNAESWEHHEKFRAMLDELSERWCPKRREDA